MVAIGEAVAAGVDVGEGEDVVDEVALVDDQEIGAIIVTAARTTWLPAATTAPACPTAFPRHHRQWPK